MLTRTVESYVSLFASSTLLPVFKLHLCLEGASMEFFPAVADLESAVLAAVDVLDGAMASVPTIQSWLSGASPYSTSCIGLDPAVAERSRASLRCSLETQLQGPLQHLEAYSACAGIYNCYTVLHAIYCMYREV